MTAKTARSSMSAPGRARIESDAPLELFAGAFADALAQRDRCGGVQRLELVEQRACVPRRRSGGRSAAPAAP